MPTITAADPARHTREVLDRVVRRGQAVIVEHNPMPVARLLPPKPVMTAAQALEALSTDLTVAQADSWPRDSRGAFNDTH